MAAVIGVALADLGSSVPDAIPTKSPPMTSLAVTRLTPVLDPHLPSSPCPSERRRRTPRPPRQESRTDGDPPTAGQCRHCADCSVAESDTISRDRGPGGSRVIRDQDGRPVSDRHDTGSVACPDGQDERLSLVADQPIPSVHRGQDGARPTTGGNPKLPPIARYPRSVVITSVSDHGVMSSSSTNSRSARRWT